MKSKYKFYELISIILLSIFLSACGSGSSSNDDTVTVSVTGLVRTADCITIEGVEAYNSDGVLATSDADGSISFIVDVDKVTGVRLRKSGYAAQTVELEVVDNAAIFLSMKIKASVRLSFDKSEDA